MPGKNELNLDDYVWEQPEDKGAVRGQNVSIGRSPRKEAAFVLDKAGLVLFSGAFNMVGLLRPQRVKSKSRFSQEWRGNLVISSLAVGKKKGLNLVW